MSEPVRGRIRTSDGLELVYDEFGTGLPVVFVHGMGLSRLRWRRPFGAAARAGYRAVRYDLRGFGDSEMPSELYDMDRLVRDLAEVVDVLGAEHLHLVGHSLGGMIALAYTLEHLDRIETLTLASTTAHNGGRSGAMAAAAAVVAERGFEQAVADPEARRLVEAAIATAFPDGLRPDVEQVGLWFAKLGRAEGYAWRAAIGFSVKDRLSEIGCPVLVLHGTADPLMPVRAGELLAEKLPNATFVPLPGAGHSVQVERGKEFAEALVAHLRSDRPGSATM